MKNLFLPLWVLLLFAGVACNNAPAGDQAAEEETTTEEMAAENADTEEEPAEDKSQRKSPPRAISGKIGDVDVTINYGSPSVRDREIWGSLVPYGQVWRTGANEATTVEFSDDVVVEGQPLAAGRYSLFTIPAKGDWTVIFNKVADQWGAYEYKESEDALRVDVTPKPRDENMEELTFTLEEGRMVLHWEKLMVPVSVAPAS